jgi:hypothetical protein
MTKVVNIKTCRPKWGRDGDVVIDRTTPWGNPFRMKDNSQKERDRVCNSYEEYFGLMQKVRSGEIRPIVAEQYLVDLGLSPAAAMILARDIAPLLDLSKLLGVRRLGCHCRPSKRCHGDTLRRLIERRIAHQAGLHSGSMVG